MLTWPGEKVNIKDKDGVSLKIGSKLKIGEKIILEVSQIGKECHQRCSIYYQAGDCVMPREGIFARVLKGGILQPGDRLEAID